MDRRYLWALLATTCLTSGLCPAAEPNETEHIAVTGQVVDEQSQGVAGVSVTGIAHNGTTHATTDEQGRFTLDLPAQGSSVILADDPGTDRLGIHTGASKPPLKIALAKCRRVPVEVLDADGKPAEGVSVGTQLGLSTLLPVTTDAAGKAELRLPSGAQISSLYAIKPDVGFDYVARDARNPESEWLKDSPVRLQLAKSQTIRIQLIDPADQPIAGTEVSLWLLHKPDEARSTFNLSGTPKLFRSTTGADGVAVFRGVPAWNESPLTFWPVNKEYVRRRIVFDAKKHTDGNVTAKLQRPITAEGHVLFADGKPAAGIRVTADGAGYTFDRCRRVATTDADGRFEMRLDPDQLYMFVVTDKKWAAPMIDGIVAVPNEPIDGLKFELRPATRVHGRVTAGRDAKPVAGQSMLLAQNGRGLHLLEGVTLPNPENSRNGVQPQISQSVPTDEKGEFEFFAGPGNFVLWGPSQVEVKKFEITDQAEVEANFAAPRVEEGPFSGRVVTGEPPQPVPMATIDGVYRSNAGRRDLRLRADAQGRFSGERYLHRTVLHAKSPDGKLAGIIQIEPDDKEATIAISPVASIKARVIDEVTRNPLANTKIQWGRQVHIGDDNAPWSYYWGGSTTTDDQGFFEVTGLVVGQEYTVTVPSELYLTTVLTYTPKEAGMADVGELRRSPPPKPYKPPTLAERIDRLFVPDRPIAERYDTAVKESPLFRQNILVVFLQRGQPVTESWFKLVLEDRKVRTELYNFKVLAIDAKAEGAAALAEKLGVDIAAEKLPAWAFRDAGGKPLEQGSVPLDAVDNLADATIVLEKLRHFAPEPLDAHQILNDALAEAKASNRRVIVQETATWCGPCHMLALYLEAHRTIWDKDYIWIRMDERWTGYDEVMEKFREKRAGIPWCVILDAEGKSLITSDGPNGNFGFPSEPDGIEYFMKMLRSTRQRLTEEDLATLRKDLEPRVSEKK